MEMIYVIIIALIVLYLLNRKEGYSTVLSVRTEQPSYSSPNSTLDWLNVSDLDYGRLVTTLQGKRDAVRIRNLG
jgi:hypothetical protein